MGLMFLVIGIVCLILWLIVSKKPYIKQVTYHLDAAKEKVDKLY